MRSVFLSKKKNIRHEFLMTSNSLSWVKLFVCMPNVTLASLLAGVSTKGGERGNQRR